MNRPIIYKKKISLILNMLDLFYSNKHLHDRLQESDRKKAEAIKPK